MDLCFTLLDLMNIRSSADCDEIQTARILHAINDAVVGIESTYRSGVF